MSTTILLTGAGRGIGRAIAEKLAIYFTKENKSLNLILCSRTEAELKTVCSSVSSPMVQALPVCCDISKSIDRKMLIEAAHSAFGSIDILINNAGISHIGLLQDMSDEQIDELISTNLVSAISLSSAVINDLLKSPSPAIISISSVWGNVGASCEAVYSASKGGINAFTKALAKELAPSGIPVNAIACGYIDTAMNNHLDEEEKLSLFEDIPAGRPGTPEEISDCILMLINSPKYLTGQIITVDGGWT